MATVIDYLNKKREEDPSLSGLTYRGVYSKLQEANDPYLPEWEAVTTASSKPSGQTSYERKAHPDFVNDSPPNGRNGRWYLRNKNTYLLGTTNNKGDVFEE